MASECLESPPWSGTCALNQPWWVEHSSFATGQRQEGTGLSPGPPRLSLSTWHEEGGGSERQDSMEFSLKHAGGKDGEEHWMCCPVLDDLGGRGVTGLFSWASAWVVKAEGLGAG